VLNPGQFGPSYQRIEQTTRDLPKHAGSVINDYHPTEEKLVKISSIKSAQTEVYPKTVKRYSERSVEEFSPVQLWKDSKGLRVFDGNHRINAAIARGDTHIAARIWKEPK
jgi:hypothetical protein